MGYAHVLQVCNVPAMGSGRRCAKWALCGTIVFLILYQKKKLVIYVYGQILEGETRVGIV